MTIPDRAPAPDSLRTLGPRTVLGECPIWDPRLGVLFWVDIDGRRVHRWDWEADALSPHSLTGRPGCIALTTALEHCWSPSSTPLGLLDWTTGAVRWQLELAIAEPTIRLNDGRVDGRETSGSARCTSRRPTSDTSDRCST